MDVVSADGFQVLNLVLRVGQESWRVLLEAAPWVLLGFAAAGLLKAFVPENLLARQLGGNSLLSVLKAAIIGAPLPLCSCGVLPAALGLRRQGAGSGATAAFLIATPETGVDSVALTWALLGPIMALARPVAALATALGAGVLANALDRHGAQRPDGPLPGSAATGCGCGKACHLEAGGSTTGAKLRLGLHYVLDEMLADIGPWLLGGILVSGIIGVLFPPDFLASFSRSGPWPYLAMLAAGIPLYVCATSSTPVAAVLVLKGLSPGAALVFLLAGPATNAATLAVILRVLGRRVAGAYLLAITACALGLGFGLDFLLASTGWSVAAQTLAGGGEAVGLFEAVCAMLLVGLVGRTLWRRLRPS